MEPVALLIGIAVFGLAAYSNHRYVRGSRDVVRLADEEFRQILVSEGRPELCFDGRTADIVAESVAYCDEYRIRAVSVTRYARNSHGEYFFFVSEGRGRAFFKHIDHQAARAALGTRYVEP